MTFDSVVIVDWSAASAPSPARPSADAIWIGEARGGVAESSYLRTRAAAEAWLRARIATARRNGERLLVGADFAFGYPAGFAQVLTGRAEALAVWEWLAGEVTEGPGNSNDRFEVAARMNRAFPGLGPFWFNPKSHDIPDLPRKGSMRHGYGALAQMREVDGRAKGAQSVWKLGGAGSVGSQVLTGLPVLWRLRAQGGVAVWPFEPWDGAPVVLAEVFPSLLASEVAALIPSGRRKNDAPVKDDVQVRLLALVLARLGESGAIDSLFAPGAPDEILREEGWTLGVGSEELLQDAAREVGEAALPNRPAASAPVEPPRLRDDCFALPQGVRWVPVDTALQRLRAALHPLTGTLDLPTGDADGHVLAQDVPAARSHPPAPNAAVDGYGFAYAATGGGVQRLPLVDGRAAAGQPYRQEVPAGTAIRILTGASLPDGVDTVILEEDTALDGAAIVFDGPVRRGANTREAGEDVVAGTPALRAGRRLTPPDLALLSALGVGEVAVHRRLRVAVLSTGDELVAAPAADTPPDRIHDANRPMLRALAARWGFDAVDLGCQPDDPQAIAAALDRGAASADAVLVSGGASAGDEDHVSRLLRARGHLSSWRIALKPGRPLALAMWDGTPVFGLPGNPVAAFVCALIFARPALSLLAGAGWVEARGFDVAAAFSKDKKPGRREYLRACLDAQGRAEVFASEGSGRISGLSWATGLVELPDAACTVRPGTRVRYFPFAEFGIA